MYLDDALAGYWLDKGRTVSPRTVLDYQLTFRRLREFLGPAARIEAVTADDLRRFLDDVQTRHQLGPKSVINVWIALSSLWTWAEKELRIPHAVRGIERPRYRRPPVNPLTRLEISALLVACDHAAGWDTTNHKRTTATRPTALRDRAVFLVLLDTGIRAQELCDLAVGDYDQRTGQLHIRRGKGGKGRYVYAGDAARKALWKYLANRQDARNVDPLLATRTGTHMDIHALRHMVDRCADRAGVLNVHPHRFRHTFAITYLRNGGSVLELQAMLGHERMDTIRIYATLAQVDLQQAQKRASPADNWGL